MSHTFLLNIDMIFIIFLEKDMLKLFVIIYYSQYSACYGYIKKNKWSTPTGKLSCIPILYNVLERSCLIFCFVDNQIISCQLTMFLFIPIGD